MTTASAAPVAVVAIREPITQINKAPIYAVLDGPSTVSWQQYPASSVSNGNIQISANQPDRSTLIDRRVYIQLDAAFTFSGTNTSGTGTLLNIGVNDSLRSFPIASTTSSMTMKIGGKAVTQGSYDEMWPAMMRYHNMVDQRNLDYSITPAMLDQYQDYVSGFGSARNPLGDYGDNPHEMTRGGWTNSQITNLVNEAGATTASFNVTITEPLLLSPFLFARNDNEPALIGVDTFNYTQTFDSLSRMWSHFDISGSGVSLTGVSVNLTGARLLFKQMTPSVTQAIPRALSYSYFNPVLYVQESASGVTSGSSATLNSSVITLPGVPRRLYVYVSQRQEDKKFTSSDTMFSIDGVTVKWGTKTYLREASAVDLFNIAVKNGCNLSWPQWRQFCGGILCLDMGSDIGLSALEAAGSEGKFQVTIQVQCTNQSLSTITPALNIVGVQEGMVQIIAGTVYVNENPIGYANVLNAKQVPGITYKKSESVYGGNFFSDLVNTVISPVREVAKVAHAIGKEVLPIASFIPGVGHIAQAAQMGLPVLKAIGGNPPRHKRRKVGRKAIRRKLRGRGLEDQESEDSEESEGEDEQQGDMAEGEAASASEEEEQPADDARSVASSDAVSALLQKRSGAR